MSQKLNTAHDWLIGDALLLMKFWFVESEPMEYSGSTLGMVGTDVENSYKKYLINHSKGETLKYWQSGNQVFFGGGACFLGFLLFRAWPAAYEGSQARGWIGTIAASLHYSSWQRQILNPLSRVRDQTHILINTSRVCNPMSHNRNSWKPVFWIHFSFYTAVLMTLNQQGKQQIFSLCFD